MHAVHGGVVGTEGVGRVNIFDCPASEPLRRTIFGTIPLPFLTSRLNLGAWPDYWVSVEFLHALIPRKVSGSTTTTTTISAVAFMIFLLKNTVPYFFNDYDFEANTRILKPQLVFSTNLFLLRLAVSYVS